jgi:hypothetical protein
VGDTERIYLPVNSACGTQVSEALSCDGPSQDLQLEVGNRRLPFGNQRLPSEQGKDTSLSPFSLNAFFL